MHVFVVGALAQKSRRYRGDRLWFGVASFTARTQEHYQRALLSAQNQTLPPAHPAARVAHGPGAA